MAVNPDKQYLSTHPHRLLIDGDASVFLRLASLEDIEKYYQLIHENREHLSTYQRWAKDINFEMTYQAVEASVARLGSDGWLQYRIVLPQLDQEHRMIGTVTMYDRDVLNATACLGVWLAQSEQGKGYAKKACLRLMEYAFHAWNLRTVYMEIDVGNERSEGLATRLGGVPGPEYQHTEPDGEVLTRRKWAINRQ